MSARMPVAPDPIRLFPDAPGIAATHALLVGAFAYMDTRIDPPSSMGRLSVAALADEAQHKELWIVPGGPLPLACVIFTLQPDALYIGKLAVAPEARGLGLARRLVDLGAERAALHGRDRLRLQVRVELTENQATFARLGFRETGRTAHAGYDRPTSITFERDLPPAP